MAIATGVSVKGRQVLATESGAAYSATVSLTDDVPVDSRYVGYAAIEVANTEGVYEAVGKSIWYQGVVLYLPVEFRYGYYQVVAFWRYPDLPWRVETF